MRLQQLALPPLRQRQPPAPSKTSSEGPFPRYAVAAAPPCAGSRDLDTCAVDCTGPPRHVHRPHHFVHSRQEDIHLQAGAAAHSLALARWLHLYLTRDAAGHERGRGAAVRLGRLKENARKHVRGPSFIFGELARDTRSPVTLFFSALLSLSRRSVARLRPSPPSLCPHATPTPAETRSPPWLPLRVPRLHRGQRG